MSIMLNTKNIRVAVTALFVFSIVGYFLFHASSFPDVSQRVQVPVSAENAVKPDAGAAKEAASGNDAPYTPSLGKTGSISDTAEDSENEAASDEKAAEKVPESPKGTTPKYPVSGKTGSTDKTDKTDKTAPKDTTKQSLSKPKPAGGKTGSTLNGGAKCEKTDYVVMIDAGSTGSRVHVYSFDTCVSPPALLNEEFKMLKPGLSSFDTDTTGAASSLDPLLELALATVPKEKQGCTPVAVKATAGLRLLGAEKSDAILAEVRRHLETDYPFAVVDGEGISIMDGKDEGVYAWITTNYLLGNIGSKEKTPTAAVFDLGGGSTQIVFEPDMGDNEKMAEGEHKYEFSFGDRDFTLYQFSHLGYGLMQGRNKVNSLILSDAIKHGSTVTPFTSKADAKGASASVSISNPCFPPGVVANDVQVEVSAEEIYVVNFKGPSEASGAQCRHFAERVLNMEAECTSKPCSFNGVYQPSLVKAFNRNSDMWVFSYFYDRTNPLGFPSSFTVEELRDLTKTVCAGENLWQEVLLGASVKELQAEPNWCLDLSFITAMLHTGYNIPLLRELRTAKTISNNELGWCLGASLPLLNPKEGGWKCRVKEATSAA